MEKKFIVRFFDSQDRKWYDVTAYPVSIEEAELIYNEQTYQGQLHTKKEDSLFFQIKEVE